MELDISQDNCLSRSFDRFHKGTKAKFGKAKADKQAVAAALSTARRSGGKRAAKKKAAKKSTRQRPLECGAARPRSRALGYGEHFGGDAPRFLF